MRWRRAAHSPVSPPGTLGFEETGRLHPVPGAPAIWTMTRPTASNVILQGTFPHTGAGEAARARDGGQAAKIVFQAAVSSGYNQRSTCRPSRYRKMLMTRVCTSTLLRRAPIVLIAQTC